MRKQNGAHDDKSGPTSSTQRHQVDGDLQPTLAYWKQQLGGAPAVLELPTSFPRRTGRERRDDFVTFAVPVGTGDGVRALCESLNAPPAIVLSAAFHVVLARWSRQDDVVVGTTRPKANEEDCATDEASAPWARNPPECCATILPLRSRLSADTSFASLIGHLEAALIGARAHQNVSFDDLVRALGGRRADDHHPIFQVGFMMDDGAPASFERRSTGAADTLDLTLSLAPRDGAFDGRLSFDGSLFDRASMERFARHYVTLLTAAISAPGAAVARLPLMSADELRTVLVDWNATRQELDTSSVVEQIARRAGAAPKSLAIKDATMRLSYGELEARANRLAHVLRRRGIGREDRVATLFERSVMMVVAELAVMKAGAAYVPLDPAHPKSRIELTVADAGAKLVLSVASLHAGIHFDVPVLDLDDGPTSAEIASESEAPPSTTLVPEQAAYVIYTSGTTGKPKGVVLEHRSLANLLGARARFYGFAKADRFVQFTSPAFDATMLEVWSALTSGGSLHVIDDDTRRSPADIVAWLRSTSITVAFLPTAIVETLLEHDWTGSRLRVVETGGDALTKRPPADLPFRLVNLYGPTETTVVATGIDVDPHGEGAPSIGRPIDNARVYVLSKDDVPGPIGVAGELYIGGRIVGRGYLDRPALTAERFIPDPFSDDPGARMYRTGDLVRFRADGSLEFLGRIDRQVKIRGHRIELGEVEATLATCDGVATAVVIAREDTPGDKRLVAYVVPTTTKRAGIAATLRETMGASLPEYMVPNAFVLMGELPLNSSGKVDRAALPPPHATEGLDEEEYVAPRTELEHRLAAVFASVLRLPRVSIHADFFSLGGDSISVIQVVARIRAEGLHLTPNQFGAAPTVAQLAAAKQHAPAPLPLAPAHERRSGALSPADVPSVSVDQDALDRITARATGAREKAVDVYALTPLQEGLLFHHIKDVGDDAYVPQIVLSFDDSLDAGALEAALQALVDRHAVLRTSFVWDDVHRPVQVVHEHARFVLERLDWSGIPLDELDAELERFLETNRRRGFDLRAAPLSRGALLQTRAGLRLVWATHHIIFDGWSTPILLRELLALYLHRTKGRPLDLEPPPRFGAYIEWLVAQRVDDARAYFERTLAGFTEPTTLFPPGPSTQWGKAVHELPADLSRELGVLARRLHITLGTILHAAWAIVLARLTGKTEVLLGSTSSGRSAPVAEIDRIVGLLINPSPVRIAIPDAPIRDWLPSLHRHLTELRSYEHVALSSIHGWSEIAAGQPLFEALLTVENYPDDNDGLKAAAGLTDFRSVDRTHYPLSLVVTPGTRTRFVLAYESVRFGDFAPQAPRHLEQVLRQLVDTPAAHANTIRIVTDEERARIDGWNRTEAARPEIRLAHELFEKQATRTPSLPAVKLGSQTLSYAALDQRANRIARRLEAAVRSGDRVGVCLSRSFDMVAAVLAVLKLGAAYVPLDASYPTERLAAMVADARPSAILTENALLARLPDTTGAAVIRLDREASQIDALPDARLARAVDERAACYVIYTSGSTGRPKGVVMPHRALVNLIHWQHESRVPSGGVTLQFTPLSFDVSFQELFSTWHGGGCLVLIGEEDRRDPDRLLDVLEEARIERLFLPFVALKNLALAAARRPELPRSLRCVVTAGEQLQITNEVRALFERLASRPNGCTLHNQYGPSETHVVTEHELEGPPASWPRLPPIGKPIANTTAHVLDTDLAQVPIGVPGELYLGGDAVADGYLDRPELTAERFVTDPHSRPGGRLYRTGDLVRWRADGTLEFLGRADAQVKVRGYRIEPGEIEAALSANAGVRDAAVVVREDDHGEKQLVAYVTPRGTIAVDVDALKSDLRRTLPEYMVPSAIVALASLPLTPSGKVDRKKLPAPSTATPFSEDEYVAPRDEVEAILAGVFASVLGMDRVGVHDNFFELGGSSLVATRAVHRVRGELGASISVDLIFEEPTIAGLAARIRATSSTEASDDVPLVRIDRTQPLPASFAQARIWFVEQLEGPSEMYSVAFAARLAGRLDADALERAVQGLVDRHEALRTTLSDVDGVPHQRIHGEVTVPFARVEVDGDDEARVVANAELARRFDLENGPVVRAALVRIQPEEHLFVLNAHHIATDGWSTGILLRDLSRLYGAAARGEDPTLPPLAIDYADFSAWQARWLSGERLSQQISFWKEHLAGAPDALDLPLDKPRPPHKQTRGDIVRFELPESTAAGLRKLCQDAGASPFMVLLTAFQAVLSRWSGQRDVVVGTPVANRAKSELQDVVGSFVNTIALRSVFDIDTTFATALERLKRTSLAAFAHQDFPFEKLVDELAVTRDTSRTPVFQAFFFLNVPISSLELPGITAHEETVGEIPEEFDLSLAVDEETLAASITFDVALFERSTIERFAAHYLTLLGAALSNPDARVDTLPILGDAERRAVLFDWNDTWHALPSSRLVHEQFEDQVDRTPDSVALETGTTQWTYRELEVRANRIAQALRARGVRPDHIVALCIDRGPSAVAAVLGCLKAGAAYAPLDLTQPPARIAMLVDDLSPALLLATRLTQALVPDAQPVLWIDDLEGDDTRASVTIAPDSAAYVLFTSGSTGKPKAVVNTHRGILNHMAWLQGDYPIDPSDVVLHKAPLTFDGSVFEILWPLMNGARLAIVQPDGHKDPRHLAEIVRRHRVTVADFVPSMLDAFLAEATPDETSSLRRVLAGGEVLTADLRRRFSEAVACDLVNSYGPTEAAVNASHWLCPRDGVAGDVVPLGRPIWNTQLFVLDADLAPVGLGHSGELFIGGSGLARGYRGRPDLTAERFVPDPFSTTPGSRMYRTGDLARRLPDGTLQFLGRADHQLKLRGQRIELGEIEAALRSLDGIAHAVVVPREDVPGDVRLVAYVVPLTTAIVTPRGLKDAVVRLLPSHWGPRAFDICERALPLTTSGKIDRKALPAPEYSDAAYVAPRDLIEETLAEIVADVLNVPRVGVHDDFFALGGHSLLATRAANRIRKAFAVEVSVRDLFDAPSVAGLAGRVRTATGGNDDSELTRVERTELVPASFAQARLWFLEQLEGPSATYNVPAVLRLAGALDVSALERALGTLVERHESLRTTFVALDGAVHQQIHPHGELALAQLDATSEDDARWLVRADVERPFDLAKGPLARAAIVRLERELHLFVLTIHHIATDGWSADVITRDLSRLYAAFVRGEASPLVASAFDYVDFSVWQRRSFTEQRLARQVGFWKEHLAGAPHALELPTDRPRPALKQYRGGLVSFDLPEATAEGVRTLCRNVGSTPFMVLLTAFQAVLSRWSGQKDVVVGTPIANRTRESLEGIVGFFVNTLALRSTFEEGTTFTDALARLKRAAIDAYAHQDIPFEKLVDELAVPRDTSRNPVFQALFTLDNAEPELLELPGLVVTSEPIGGLAEKFDLSLGIEVRDGAFHGVLSFDVALFDRETIARFATHFANLVRAAVGAPNAPVASLKLMGEEERQMLLREWSGATAVADYGPCVHERFEAHARMAPNATALVFDGQTITYGELDARANQLAHHLRVRGVGPETIVALRLERSIEMVVGVLGILKAGGAYLPLDPVYPPERAAFMIADSGASVLVSTRGLQIGLAAPHVVLVDELDAAPAEAVRVAVGPSNLAYVIYTSGSTGQPKGALVTHGNVSRLFDSTDAWFGFGPGDTWTLFHSIAFDFSVWELWGALAYGGKLVIVPYLVSRSADEVLDLVNEQGVTVLNQTPSAFRAFADATLARGVETKLRLVVFGGEALDVPSLAPWFARFGDDRPELVNMYGITETTVHVTYRRLRTADTLRSSSVIGEPIPDLGIYVLDPQGELLPVGIPGELHVAGAGLARGYLGRPELTASRFVSDRFAGIPGARMYRTGDLARWRSDGVLEYLGRIDDQVKIRGFRIELGEIESALVASPTVGAATVVVREDVPGDKRLVGYVVPVPGEVVVVDNIKAFLRKTLPPYMVPTAFVTLDSLPLTPNGKIDRRALAAPDFTDASIAYVAPRTTVEKVLAEIFQDVLRVPRVGVHDDFFALGGHSLLAMKVIARISAALYITIPVRALMASPTIAALSALIARGALEELPESTRRPQDAPLTPSFAQEMSAAWEEGRAPSVTWSHALRLELRGRFDARALDDALAAMLERQEALCLGFDQTTGIKVIPASELGFTTIDLYSTDDRDAESFADHQCNGVPFVFDGSPLARFFVLKRSNRHHDVVIVWHAFVHDPSRASLIGQELLAHYRALVEQSEPPAALPIRYLDYAFWERRWFEAASQQHEVAAARKSLEGARPVDLAELPRPARVSAEGITRWFAPSAGAFARVESIARAASTSPFSVFAAITALLTWRWTGNDDVVFLAPTNVSKARPELDRLIGRFFNLIAIRISTAGDPTFGELVRRARLAVLEAHKHQTTPMSLILDCADPFTHPLGRVALNTPMLGDGITGAAEEKIGDDLVVTEHEVDNVSGARNDLAIVLMSDGDQVFGGLRGAAELMHPETVERRCEELAALLDVLDANTPLSRLGVR